MSNQKCPGQDTRYWRPEDINEVPCHACGTILEFWKDEPHRRCTGCGARVRNPKVESGCAKWCNYAKECLGYVPLAEDAEESVCDQLISELKQVFKNDQPRISHALSVLGFAEDILAVEKASPIVVKAAAVLHDIGIHEAESKHGSASAQYQEIEGPPIAKKIMEGIGLDEPTVEHVCRIIANHHSARDIDTPEFRIVWDCDWLVNFPDQFPDANKESLKQLIEKIFKTEAGRNTAYRFFIDRPEQQAG